MTMNRLDARARLVFHYAREEADRLGHAVIESEHLLLGLLREGGTASQVLVASGLTLEAARHRVVELIGRFERSRDAPPPAITALARRVMDLAGVEAATYQSSFINTGFVLLGMIHAGDGVAMGIINQTAGGTKAVRKATLVALQLPPDAGTDIEENSTNSSLSGIVAVPADSVLARLFNRGSEQNLEPKSQVTPELTSQVVPELTSQVAPELSSQVVPESVTPAMNMQVVSIPESKSSLESIQLEPVNQVVPTGTTVAEIMTEAPPLQSEDKEDEIPDSMLIDEAFDEVPPELESVEIIQAAQFPLIQSIQIPEVETPAQIYEVQVPTQIPEAEVPIQIPEAETPIVVDEKAIHSPMIEAEPIITNQTQLNSDELDPSTKVTAEVLVAEVEVMPETILQSEKPNLAVGLSDSTDGLLVSDLLETPFGEDSTLVSYQTPALIILSEPQTTLESHENQNLSLSDTTQNSNVQDPRQTNQTFLSEIPEPSQAVVTMLEPESQKDMPEPTKRVHDFELQFETFQQESTVQETSPDVELEAEQPKIDLPSIKLENSEPQISRLSTEVILEEPTTQVVLEVPPTQIVLEEPTTQVVIDESKPEIILEPEAPSTQSIEPAKSEPTTHKIASWDMVTASSVIKRQIIALGGGGFSDETSNLLLDQYILKVASSAREVAVPRVCFISTAAGDSDVYIKRFYKAFEQLNCQASHLPLFHTEDWAEDLEDMILSADVLYFSGGSTKNALALWQAWQLEPIFKQAYEAGTVFTGVSAGAICWFEQFTTDSIGRSLGVMNGLGWLPGSFTPHYDTERYRRPTLEKFLRAQKISPGFAADDNAAVHFVNGEYIGAVASTPTAKAYHVTLGRNRLVESPLETQLLSEVS